LTGTTGRRANVVEPLASEFEARRTAVMIWERRRRFAYN
jgi:hypothetical protein